MFRTLLFVLVVGFTISARAKMSVVHINHGIPSHCGVDRIDTNDSFFTSNNIPIVGYSRNSNDSLQFTFNVRACNRALIKHAAYTTEYSFLNESTLLVKLQINPDYIHTMAEQASCYSKAVSTDVLQQDITILLPNDLKKRFGRYIDVRKLTIIMANDYQNESNLLDLTTLQKIENFVGQN